MRTVLIDADILAFQVSVAAEVETEFHDDIHVLWADAKKAKQDIDEAVDAIIAKVDADDAILCLTSPNNFRKDVLPSYKGNRTGRKPMVLPAMRQHILDHHVSMMIDGLEGDDCIGIMATQPQHHTEYVIYSADKDMRTIPAPYWDEEDGMIVDQSIEAADRFWLTQVLTGDTTDGYKGLPNCGPVKANKLLDKDCSYEAVEAAYVAAGLTKRQCLQQARVARILRYEDFDQATEKPILWRPSND